MGPITVVMGKLHLSSSTAGPRRWLQWAHHRRDGKDGHLRALGLLGAASMGPITVVMGKLPGVIGKIFQYELQWGPSPS